MKEKELQAWARGFMEPFMDDMDEEEAEECVEILTAKLLSVSRAKKIKKGQAKSA